MCTSRALTLALALVAIGALASSQANADMCCKCIKGDGGSEFWSFSGGQDCESCCIQRSWEYDHGDEESAGQCTSHHARQGRCPSSEALPDASYAGIGELQSAPASGAGLPVVFMHGMGDSGSNSGMKSLCASVTKKYPDTYSVCLDVANGMSSIFENLDKQLDEFVQAVRSDPKLANGFNAVGLSQGNLLIRAYIERYNSPKVSTYVSMCGPHGGIQTCPGIYKLFCGLWKVDVYGHSLAFSDYWKDPTDKNTYLAKSRFLADINNEKDAKNATYKSNMESLSKYVLVEAMLDSMVLPHVSEQHGFYAWGSTTETQQLEETDGYKGDWLGLQTLDKAGKLKKLSYQGDHLRWSQGFWEDTILPFLGPGAEGTLVV